MRYFLTALIFLWGFAIKAQSHSHQTKQEKTDGIVVAKIHSLPEVKHFFIIANKSELPDVMIDETPDSTNNWRYRVKVGYSKDMYRSVLIFDVDAKTLDIYYEDFMDESGLKEITLQQWRLWRNDPLFSNEHKFKNGKLVALAK